MTNRLALAATTLAAVLLYAEAPGAAESSPSKSYRWVDKNGVTHYGDSVPPEYASQGAAELNPQGVRVRETPRQLSAAEAVEAQKVASDAARSRQHDAFLLSTYSHVRDIELLRDERVSLIEGQMEIARGSIASINQRITSLQERMRNFQPYSSAPGARRLPDQLAEEAVRAMSERHGLQAGLDSREAEKNELRIQFDADIARYRELTGRSITR